MRRRERAITPHFLCALGVALAALGAGCSDDTSLSDEQGWADWAAAGGGRYEKNPEVPLAREYWAIVAMPDGARAMSPRPDGDPLVSEEARPAVLSRRCSAPRSSARRRPRKRLSRA